MKNLLVAAFLLLLSSVVKSQVQTITYTPMTAAGYQFKYGKFDSGLNVPNIDTSTRRGTTRPGSIVIHPITKVFYGWDGTRWNAFGNTTSSGIFVDSITVAGNNICQWVQGTPTCYTLTGGGTFIGIDSVTYAGNSICQWKAGVPTCYSVLPGVDSVTVVGDRLCQWIDGDSTCYDINGNVLGTGIDSVTVIGNQLCQWTGGTPICYTINNTSSGIDSITVTDSLLCSWSQGVSECFNIWHEDTIGVEDDLTSRYDTTLRRWVIGREHDDGLISGGIVTKAGCWTVDVTSVTYYFNNRRFIVGQLLGLDIDSSDVLPRVDYVIADSLGYIRVLKGTPSPTPQDPVIDISWEVLLPGGRIYIPGGASCLNIQTELIYDENLGLPTEWDAAPMDSPMDFDNTDQPYTGAKAGFMATYNTGDQFAFTGGLDTAGTQIFKGFFYFNGTFVNQIQARWYLDLVPVSNSLILNGYFNPLDSNRYVNVSVPLSAWNFTGQTFNRLVFTMAGNDLSGAKGFYVDYLQLQTGIENVSKTYVDSVNRRGDSIYYWKNGIPFFASAVGSGGGGAGGIGEVVAGYGLTNVNDSTLMADSTLLLTKLGAAAIYQPILPIGTASQHLTGGATPVWKDTAALLPFSFTSPRQHDILWIDTTTSPITVKNFRTVFNAPLSWNYSTGEASISNFSSSASGTVPASNGTARQVLHGDGVWRDTTAGAGAGWGLTGNSITAGTQFLGTTNNTSLNVYANNTRYFQFDSLGAINVFPAATPKTVLTFWRNSSTVTKCTWFDINANQLHIITQNTPVVFKTNVQAESFRITELAPVGTTAGSDQAILVGRYKAKVIIPTTSANVSYGLSVANASDVTRFSVGLDSAENGILGVRNRGIGFYEDNAASTLGFLFRMFATTGNIMIKQKGAYTEDTASRFTVVSDRQGTIPAPVMTTTARVGISTGVVVGNITAGGTGYVSGNYTLVPLTGGSGSGAVAGAITVTAGIVTAVNLGPTQVGNNRGNGYVIGDVLSASAASLGGSGSGFTYTVTHVTGEYLPKGLQVYDSTAKQNSTYDGTRWTYGAKILIGSSTLNFGSTLAQTSSDLTITVTGAADGDVVSVGVVNASTDANSSFSAFVSSANTVTVRFNNYSAAPIDPASGVFKVKVFKD